MEAHFTLYWVLLLGAISANELKLCSVSVHLARAEQSDANGLKCWDIVKVPTCGGRCDSSEIADWEFPFKKSHHPVCLYGARRPLVVRLRHCDPGVSEGTELFHFAAAEDCHCKVRKQVYGRSYGMVSYGKWSPMDVSNATATAFSAQKHSFNTLFQGLQILIHISKIKHLSMASNAVEKDLFV